MLKYAVTPSPRHPRARWPLSPPWRENEKLG
jgi:hypothetical protein